MTKSNINQKFSADQIARYEKAVKVNVYAFAIEYLTDDADAENYKKWLKIYHPKKCHNVTRVGMESGEFEIDNISQYDD